METVLLLSSILLWITVLVNFFLTLALIRRINVSDKHYEPVETLAIGQPAPDFYAETLSGERISLADYPGCSMALVFVSPDCGICHKHIPMLNRLAPKAEQSGTKFFLISDADTGQTQTYVQEYSITAPILSAPSQANPFFEDYKTNGVPSYAILDQQGLILASNALGDPLWNEITDGWGKEA